MSTKFIYLLVSTVLTLIASRGIGVAAVTNVEKFFPDHAARSDDNGQEFILLRGADLLIDLGESPPDEIKHDYYRLSCLSSTVRSTLRVDIGNDKSGVLIEKRRSPSDEVYIREVKLNQNELASIQARFLDILATKPASFDNKFSEAIFYFEARIQKQHYLFIRSNLSESTFGDFFGTLFDMAAAKHYKQTNKPSNISPEPVQKDRDFGGGGR